MQPDTGQLHNAILNAAKDAQHTIGVMPGLMRAMLEIEGWREFSRPLDLKQFTNATIDAWVLGPAYAGLGFPNWATVYAILRRNAEHGDVCERLLKEAGAPDVAQADIEVALEKAKAKPLGDAKHPGTGRGNKTDSDATRFNGRGSAYLVARIQRDHPDIAKRLADGEFKSVRAAAKAAGIVRDLTPLEQFARLWAKASTDERQLIREFIDSPVFDR